MSDVDGDAIATFYRCRVPEQTNRTLDAQRAAAADDEKAARVLEEMEAVRASIVVVVEGESDGTFAFDIDRGEMRAVATPSRPPFLVLRHDAADFESLRTECGDSLLGFLGGLAGLGDEMRITAQRVRSLRDLAGGITLALEDGFRLDAWFGITKGTDMPPAIDGDTGSTIRLDAETYARLRDGGLDPQDAFLAGAIPIEGDEGLAIGLALAALSPE